MENTKEMREQGVLYYCLKSFLSSTFFSIAADHQKKVIYRVVRGAQTKGHFTNTNRGIE